jgi:hypothetical protein
MVRALWLVRQSERTYFSHSHYYPDEPHRILAISAFGTFETCQAGLTMSVVWGRPAGAGTWPNRRD